MGIRSDLQTELRNLLSSDIVKGKVAVQRAYADWRRYPQYVVPLTESSIDLIFAAAYGSAKKNATDIRLAIDAMELVFVRPEIGTFILLSGDSDFSSLVIKLKEYGKYVIGVGIRESSSDLLVQNCDEYYSYNALAGLVKFGEEEMVKWDPWELVTEAIQRMTKNGDVMRADRLKQVMQTIDSSFDEKNLGMAKFSRFVQDAAQKGLISLTRLQNGQMEVGPPSAKPAGIVEVPKLAPEVAAPAIVSASPTDDAKRTRRGGRGRDRGRPRREDRPATTAAEVVDSIPSIAAVTPVEKTVEATPVVPASGIGSGGIRLTRDEAFDLVRRAVSSLVGGSAASPASTVRATARELLGRDSESLSERNFVRILQDAHDADVVDLRKRGGDYEVAGAVSAASLAQQLADTTPPPAKPAASTAPHQKTLTSRVVRGRTPFGAKSAGMPANLLSVGVVGTPRQPIAVVPQEIVAAAPLIPEAAAAEDAKPLVRRPLRGPRKPKVAVEGEESKPARARAKRAPRSRAAATTPSKEE